MSIVCINDLHLGVQRSGGTTPQSALELKQYLRDSLETFLRGVTGNLVINGDLFDKFEVEVAEVIAVYDLFADWLNADASNNVSLVAGNHDYNPRGNKVSSFHLLGHFLSQHFGSNARVYDQGLDVIGADVWCIPHMPNQDLFNLEIEKACQMKGSYLLLHCNVKNTFAENSDHSLNLDNEQIAALIKAGWKLVIGHEHVGYELRGGKIIVVGNQFGSSCSDWIEDEAKFALRINDDCAFEYLPTAQRIECYKELDWRNLPAAEHTKFIRVTGDATATEASDVIAAIAKFRQRSSAFVISNAVKIEGVAAFEEIEQQAMDSIKAFDVVSAILSELDEKEREVVKGLLNG